MEIIQIHDNDAIIRLWVESKESLNTREAYGQDVLKLLEFLKDKPFVDVDLSDLHRFGKFLNSAKTKFGKAYAPKTKERIIVAVKSLFSFASEEGFIRANPARRLPIPRCKDNRAARTMKRDEVSKLISVAKTQRDQIILKVFYFAGLRVSEVTSLRRQDVQENEKFGGQLAVFGKGSKNRTVAIPRELYDELIKYMNAEEIKPLDPVFPSQKGKNKMTRQQIYRIVKAAAKDSPECRWDASPHRIRHCFATEAANNGMPLHWLQTVLGHDHLSTTQIYLDANPQQSASDYLGAVE